MRNLSRVDLLLRILPWLLVVSWMALIFSFSGQVAEESAHLSRGVTDAVLGAIEAIAPRQAENLDFDMLHLVLRKSAHFLVYLFLGIWLFSALRPYFPLVMAGVNAVLASFVFAIFDELHQYFVPGRVMSVWDVYLDTAGALAGVLLLALILHYQRLHEKRAKTKKTLPRWNAMLPTPIQKLSLKPNGNTLYMKRDDLIGFSFGGNKYRKALLYFEDIEKKGADTVVTTGSAQSNHCRIVANMAAQRKLSCHIFSAEEKEREAHNRTMMEMLGAETHLVPGEELHEKIEGFVKELEEEGKKPYFIKNGGHGHLGTESFKRAFDELKTQEKEMKTTIDYIFFASGTGTTHAGLAVGNMMREDHKKIVGISVGPFKEKGTDIVLESVNDYLQRYAEELAERKHILFVDDYVHEGYGTYPYEVLSVIKRVMVQEGIPLDPVYTAKAFHGMEDFLAKEDIQGKTILFWHTGGTPIYFDALAEVPKD